MLLILFSVRYYLEKYCNNNHFYMEICNISVRKTVDNNLDIFIEIVIVKVLRILRYSYCIQYVINF